MEKLKPCPFCGKSTTLDLDISELFSDYAIVCDYNEGGCGASSGYRDSEEKAVAIWNRRKGE